MLIRITSIFLLLILFLSIGRADCYSSFECKNSQTIETCTLCDYCNCVNLSNINTNIRPIYKQVSTLVPFSDSMLLKNKNPTLIFRPPIT